MEFETEECENLRIFGSWAGDRADARNRMRRIGWIWSGVKGWLKKPLLPKRKQARVVEASLESTVLHECHARVWYKRELKEVQQWMNKCYRYVSSDRNGQPLRQMSEWGVNIGDVRKREPWLKPVAWIVESRVLERILHVFRMGNERLTKAMVLGWYESCERVEGRS